LPSSSLLPSTSPTPIHISTNFISPLIMPISFTIVLPSLVKQKNMRPHLMFEQNIPPQFKILNIAVRYHNTKTYNASSFIYNFSRFIIAYLKKNKQSKNKLQELRKGSLNILKFLSLSKINGAFQYSGRIYGAKKATTFKILIGSVPLNTLDALIDYDSIMQKTRNGT